MMNEAKKPDVLGRVFVVLFALFYLSLVSLATWTRPETTALGGVVFAAVCVFGAILAISKKASCFSLLDGVVVSLCGYIFWRAGSSPVEMYGKSDQFLALVAGGVWLLRSEFSARSGLIKKTWIVLAALTFLANACCSVYQLWGDPGWGLFINRTKVASQYVSGFFSHYNYMANFCMLSMFSVLGGLMSKELGKKWQIMSGGVVAGNALLLALSHSRGAFLASMIACAVVAILALLSRPRADRGGQTITQKLAWAGGFLVILVGLVWGAQLRDSRGWMTASNEVADNGRKEFAALAVDQIMEAPLLGAGAHSVEWRSIALWPEDLWQGVNTVDYIHHEYLQLAAEYGILGLAALCLCIGVWVWTQSRLVFHRGVSHSQRWWALGSFGAVIAFLVQSYFSFVAHIPALLVTVVCIAALGLMKKGGNSKISAAFVWPRAALLLCAVAFTSLYSLRELKVLPHYFQLNDTHEVSYENDLELLDTHLQQAIQAAEVAPNWKRHEKVGLLACKALASSAELEAQQKYRSLALGAFQTAVERYPMNPMLRTNLARVLTWEKRYDEAEQQFEAILAYGSSRDLLTDFYWHYAELCVDRGTDLWMQRNTEEALYYYLKAQELLSHTYLYRLPKEMPKLLKQRVKLLESAGFEPRDPANKSTKTHGIQK